MEIDLTFAQAAIVLPREYSNLRFIIVGAGGTGSFAAPAIARLIFELKEQNKAAELLIVDPDIVESNNIPRSNFCAAEVGRFKAQTVAERTSMAWGIETGYSCERFDSEKHLKQSTADYRSLTVLVGCVDNHLARRELHRALNETRTYSTSDAPSLWWIDGGNGKSSGQVLLGSQTKKVKPEAHFAGSSICRSLPAPSLVHPELLEDQEELAEQAQVGGVSCAERVRLGEQSLNINQRVAVEMAEMLTAMFLTNSLKRFAAYFDLESGTSRSLYCTPDEVAAATTQNVQTVC